MFQTHGVDKSSSTPEENKIYTIAMQNLHMQQ